MLTIGLSIVSAGAQDIAAFWKSTLSRLAAEPIEASLTDTREPLPYKKFSVEYRSLGGIRVRALLSIPIRSEGAAPLPAIVTAPGYGGLQQGIMLDECQHGYAVLQVFPRSPGTGERLTWKLEQPEGAYYQGAYADVIRGIDYLVTRTDINRQAIAIAGTSQGGGIAIAVGALDPRIKAVVAHVPFLCDVRRAARTEGSLIRAILDREHKNDEAHLQSLEYFDPLQLVQNLKAPSLLSAGGKDKTCPAETIRSVFDRIPATKSLFYDPELTHTSSAHFYQMTWQWLGATLRSN